MVRLRLLIVLFVPVLFLGCVSLTPAQRESIITRAAEVAAEKTREIVKEKAIDQGFSEEAAQEIADRAAAKAAELAARTADRTIPEEEKKEQDRKNKGIMVTLGNLILMALGGGLKT